jgi:hypothetical protein
MIDPHEPQPYLAPMIDPDKPPPYMPPQIWGAWSLSMVLGVFNLVTSVPICAVGSFSGTDILIPVLVQAVSGLALLVGCQGILYRKRGSSGYFSWCPC